MCLQMGTIGKRIVEQEDSISSSKQHQNSELNTACLRNGISAPVITLVLKEPNIKWDTERHYTVGKFGHAWSYE